VRWPWRKRAPLPTIPPYQVPVSKTPKTKDEGIKVEEHDTSAMTQTGVHKAWKRLTGQK
jgi:hypothetical protein